MIQMASHLAVVPHPYLQTWPGHRIEGHGTAASTIHKHTPWSVQRGSPSPSAAWSTQDNRASFTEDDSEEETTSSSQSSPETELDSPTDAPTFNYRQCQPFTYSSIALNSQRGIYLEPQSSQTTQTKNKNSLKYSRSSLDTTRTVDEAEASTKQMKYFENLFGKSSKPRAVDVPSRNSNGRHVTRSSRSLEHERRKEKHRSAIQKGKDTLDESRREPLLLRPDLSLAHPENSEKYDRSDSARESVRVARKQKKRISNSRENFKSKSRKPLTSKLRESDRSSKTTVSSMSSEELEGEKLQCLTCMEDITSRNALILSCQHNYCVNCVKHIFELAVKEPSHMPPKCCQKEITFSQLPNHVLKSFDEKFPKLFRRKHQEAFTSNKTYCPQKDCGNWIRPKYFVKDTKTGRPKGICSRCKTAVCEKCNMKWHSSGPCKVDPDTQKVLDLARKQDNYQRCYSCGEMVERSAGCNHMTCKCGAQFCMLCGKKWRDPVCRTECELITGRTGNPVPEFDPAMVRGDFVEDAAFEQMFAQQNDFGEGPANLYQPLAPPLFDFNRNQPRFIAAPHRSPPPRRNDLGRTERDRTHSAPSSGYDLRYHRPQQQRGISVAGSRRNRVPSLSSVNSLDSANSHLQDTPTDSDEDSSTQDVSETESPSQFTPEGDLERALEESRREQEVRQEQYLHHEQGSRVEEHSWISQAAEAAKPRQRREVMKRLANLRLRGDEAKEERELRMTLEFSGIDSGGRRQNHHHARRSQSQQLSTSEDEEYALQLQQQFWLGEV